MCPVSNLQACPLSPSMQNTQHCSFHNFTQKNKPHLALSANHQVGQKFFLKSNEPSSWQVHSQQALLHFSWTYWRPRRLLEAWPVSVKKIFYSFGAVFSSHFDPGYFILRAESVSGKHLACCWKGRGGEWCINNENTQKLVLLTALLQ